MSDEGRSICRSSPSPGPSLLSLDPKRPACKVPLLSQSDQRIAIRYPSPPMSNPPSPQRLSQDQPASPSNEPRITAAAQTPSTTSPSMPIATALSPAYGPSPYASRESALFQHARTTATIAQPARPFSPYSTTQSQQSFGGQPASFPSVASSSTDAPTSQRGGRKSKAHVASACINCKRAHLSCDVNRPCTRCVSTGKQDTCFDVQHKKRGRPRLRDENNSKMQRMVPDSALPTPMHYMGLEAGLRTIATPRSRRAEAFRSSRSDDPNRPGTRENVNLQFPGPGMANAAAFQPPFPPHPLDYEIPTAFLDMDLAILKANDPFCQIMSITGAEAVGRPLSEIARPLDGESFQAIRAAMRIERERRDPSYMAPIVRADHDPLDGARLVDVDRYTEGFVERVHTWTQIKAGQRTQSFPARVRLAKTNEYFIAITLPSFRPALKPPPPPVMPPVPPPPPSLDLSQQPRDRDSTPRHYASLSAPAAPFLQQSMTAPLLAPLRTTGHQPTRSYPPPQPPLPYQRETQQPALPPSGFPSSSQLPPIPLSRLSPPEAITETRSFAPPRTPQELPPPRRDLSGVIQLPPILTGAAPPMSHPPTTGSDPTASGPPSFGAGDAGRSGEVSGEEGVGASRSPDRKRRKLDLGDVLHKD